MPYNRLGDIQTLTLSDNVICKNPCCILTLDNIVMLMGNFTVINYAAGGLLAKLPDSMKPLDTVRIGVYLDDTLVSARIDVDGNITCDVDINAGTLYLNGKCFNVCGTYYNSAIGNNFNQGTSPL